MEMEKVCEFCRLLRPVVYCKADAAHLCLSCDAKVHSANALSSRHPRILFCELCRRRPAHVRCSNHQLFMCRGCDCSEHDFSSEHQKRVISSYTGCPSAKDLAALWGFDLKELENSILFGSTSNVTADEGGRNANVSRQFCSQIGGSSVVSTVESITTTVSAKSNLKSRGKHTKVSRKDINQAKNSLVLQQILDLKRLQLSESSYSSSSSLGEGTTWNNLHENSAKLLKRSHLCSDVQHEDSLIEETAEKPFPLPFSQLDHVEDTGNPLNGDYSWQFKSPPPNNQLWPQNMQDLGVCDELRFLDDFKMPDFDLTFQNFEDIFGGDQELRRSVLDDNDLTSSSFANHPSIDTSDDTSIQHSAHLEWAHPRLSAESSGNKYVENGVSLPVGHDHPCHSADAESGRVESGETVIRRLKEKNFGRHERQVQRTSYKRSKSDVKKRMKGLPVKAEGYESDTANAARSF